MTTISMALKRLLDKAGSEEFLRNALENILQLLMDTDVSGQIGAVWHERTPARDNYRNGFRERRLATGVGELQLHIPKLRHGSYFPEFLEPRRLTDKSLLAVIFARVPVSKLVATRSAAMTSGSAARARRCPWSSPARGNSTAKGEPCAL